MSEIDEQEAWSERPTEEVLEEVLMATEPEEEIRSEVMGPEEQQMNANVPEEDEYLKELAARKVKEEPVASQKKKKRKHGFFAKAMLFVACAVLFGAIAGAVFIGITTLKNQKQGDAATEREMVDGSKVEPAKKITASISQAETVKTKGEKTDVSAVDVSAVVESVMPSVVSINCYKQMVSGYGYFFGGETESKEVLAGSGSGIIIGQKDTEVLIVTNYHVIDGASRISIEFVDGKSVDAVVKGSASSSDLAVVAVAFSDMDEDTVDTIRVARMGNSDDVKIGQMAIAIGNALGYGQSVTVGYISAKDRKLTVENVTYTLIQTDAAINPGNSGGALLNVNGEVIGINSVKYSDSQVEGMGFAIPITNITELIEELSNREELDESEIGYIGIQNGTDVTQEYSSLFGFYGGVYVKAVVEGSPAEEAGIHKGDIITAINDIPITGMTDLQEFLSYTPAGTKVTVTVQRANKQEYESLEIPLTLGKRPTN